MAGLRTRALAALLAALAAGCGAGAWKEADARMNEAAAGARARGFRPMAGAHNTFGVFTSAGSQAWRVRLQARPAFIAAGCTSGCTSLEFVVTDSSGTQIAGTRSGNAAPTLALEPRPAGTLLVTFRYGSCRTRECRWVAQAYERRGQTTTPGP